MLKDAPVRRKGASDPDLQQPEHSIGAPIASSDLERRLLSVDEAPNLRGVGGEGGVHTEEGLLRAQGHHPDVQPQRGTAESLQRLRLQKKHDYKYDHHFRVHEGRQPPAPTMEPLERGRAPGSVGGAQRVLTRQMAFNGAQGEGLVRGAGLALTGEGIRVRSGTEKPSEMRVTEARMSCAAC